jgi:hypothetical protein
VVATATLGAAAATAEPIPAAAVAGTTGAAPASAVAAAPLAASADAADAEPAAACATSLAFSTLATAAEPTGPALALAAVALATAFAFTVLALARETCLGIHHSLGQDPCLGPVSHTGATGHHYAQAARRQYSAGGLKGVCFRSIFLEE